MNRERETVVLLHGLGRQAASMRPLEKHLQAEGYQVLNLGYPSRAHPVDILASDHVLPAILEHSRGSNAPVHFVTHSMGGIVLRQLAANRSLTIGRVVMLSPPNQGSEIVDRLRSLKLFQWINGPAGIQLGTEAPHSLPRQLGAATFELGIITGTRSFNPLLSRMLPETNDGKVTVSSARLEGMKEFLTLDANHTFIMKNPRAIKETLHFLLHGHFMAGSS